MGEEASGDEGVCAGQERRWVQTLGSNLTLRSAGKKAFSPILEDKASGEAIPT
jgi:hypothetical protein